ncbi:MAG: tetratricopeptide repeat protein [Candidatus Peribacteraceae bacterium]|nr:tetratricopeptide repeat protein [Candidatus Peribacteraceae bacterium]MDD5074355.1 tetratricopeptide repeat protein [Candidatus Peribacteraceae bacterium]
MVYVLVLFGSLLGICLILGGRVVMRHHFVRRFVRGIRQRTDLAEERGAVILEETKIEKPRKNPRVSAIEMQQVRSLTREAEKALAQMKFDDAERLFIQALTINPEAFDVQAQLAKLYLLTDRDHKAEAMYRQLLQRHDDISYHANLGLAYYRQGKYVESCFAYQEALNRDPKAPERSAALGRACIAAQRYEEAAPLLDKAIARLSRDTALMHLLAECYLQLGHTDRAEEVYRRINKLEPYDESVKKKISALAKA